MAAGCGLLVGGGRVTERAAKLPSALAAVGTVLLIFALGTRAFRSRQAGMFAALALISTRASLPGAVVTVVNALFLIWLGLRTPSRC